VNGYGATPGVGGLGGGGNGSITTTGSAATANTGGGGGGGGNNSGNYGGGAGGSGVVIVAYPGSTPQMAGGNVTVVSNTVVHTFTSSGYLTPFVLVNNSLRWRSSNSAYLNRTPTVSSNQKTWTWSAWVKRGVLGSGSNQFLFLAGTGDTARTSVVFIGDLLYSSSNNGGGYNGVNTNAYFRDPAAWYHIVAVWDTTQASSSNRIKLYVNGVLQSVTANGTIAQNENTYVNLAGTPNTLGVNGTYNLIQYFDGYMTEIRLIDGQALTPNAFGTFNSYGVWQPVAYAGNYGTNGFYLPFTNTANTTALGYDFSPQGNNWTPTNISLTAGSTYDSMTDVPTLTSNVAANYCTLNPLVPSGATISTANSFFSQASAPAGGPAIIGTMAVTSGKWYFETTINSITSGGDQLYGIGDVTKVAITPYPGSSGTNSFGAYNYPGSTYIMSATNANFVNTDLTSTSTAGDVIQIAFDMATGYFWIGKNNTWANSGNPSAGTNPTLTGVNGTQIPCFRGSGNANGSSAYTNFGQQPWKYTPPTGFVGINTYNL
jgi:hypothetical protein